MYSFAVNKKPPVETGGASKIACYMKKFDRVSSIKLFILDSL